MKNKNLLIVAVIAMIISSCASVKIDYSSTFVPEEGGMKFTKITDENIDNIPAASFYRDINSGKYVWWHGYPMAISNDGKSIAYLVRKNGRDNFFVKSTTGIGSSVQRTFRSNVSDVAFSPDDETLCFSETEGYYQYICTTKAKQGSIIQRISPQNVKDYHPCYSRDGSKIFFSRKEGSSYSIWSYDVEKKIFTNYCHGSQPIPINDEEIICTRQNNRGNYEIWKINYVHGTEYLILSSTNQSFSNPAVSPNGEWILVTANTRPNGEKKEENLDIYVVKTDGTNLTQLTYHKGDDSAPRWSKDGKEIYFISKRGTVYGHNNIWKMDFNLE